MSSLHGKVAVVTGAASGIGRATALLFAREGAHVVLADLNVKGGEEAAAAANALGPQCAFLPVDVSQEQDIAALVAHATSKFGRLDIMVNNAGFGGAMGRLHQLSLEDWDRTLAVLLRSVFLGIKHSVPVMRQGGGGAIVSISSILGLSAFYDSYAYATSKAAVIHLTRLAALDYARDNIRVNCIAPGGISTPAVWKSLAASPEEVEAMLSHAQPIPRCGQSDDIAQAALYLVSEASSFVTGQTLVVDGGATLASMASSVRPPDTDQPYFVGPSFQRD